MRYIFEGFTLDTDRCEVTRGSEVLQLRPKVFDLLKHLLERPRKIATKDELLENLWSDVTVDETSLTQCVAALRRALAPEGVRLIRTSPRRGYVLDADVKRISDNSRPPTPRAWLGSLTGGFALGVALTWVAFTLTDSVTVPDSRIFTDTHLTVVGQPIAFGDERYRVTAGVKTLEPGQRSGWHAHSAPVFGYLMSGELTTDYGQEGVRRFPVYSFIPEAVDLPHDVLNTGPDLAEIFVIEFTPIPDNLIAQNDGE